jgi:hypothetical protein
LAKLETQIEGLRSQQQDASAVVEAHYREMLDLQRAVTDAKLALRGKSGERNLRRRAEALRAVIQRIECTFTATGATGGGPGKTNARLATVTISPVTGDSAVFTAAPRNVLPRSKVQSLW